MAQVKADLHVHINGRTSKEDFIGYLRKAESDGVKKLCLLEHDKLTNVSLIEDLLANNELQKYYTGELIVGVEYNAMLNTNYINSDGSNYDGYTCHFLTYMSLSDAKKMLQVKSLYGRDVESDYAEDYEKLMKKIRIAAANKNISVKLPTIDELKVIKQPHIVKDLHSWITSDEDRIKQYTKVLDLDSEHLASSSKFIRELAQRPEGVLFYNPTALPQLTDLLKIIRTTAPSAKVIVAHPAYMSNYFDTVMYLETLFKMPVVAGNKNFDGIEAKYYFNTPKENVFFEEFANNNNLIKTAGTDSITYTGKIQRYAVNGEVYMFEPSFGKAMGYAYYTGKYNVVVENGVKYINYIDDSSTLTVDESLFNDISIKPQMKKNNNREL